MGSDGIPKRTHPAAVASVRQDIPTLTVSMRQHNTLLRHAPRLLQTFLVIRKPLATVRSPIDAQCRRFHQPEK